MKGTTMSQRPFSNHTLSRRRAIGIAGGVMLASRSRGPAATWSTPVASPSGYTQPEILVDVSWLQNRLDDESLVVVGFMPLNSFESAHIQGSVQVDWPELEVIDTSDASLAAWRESIGSILGNLGITPESGVVAYDDGTLFAARLWWILHYLGHRGVRVLNGGLPAWRETRLTVESGEAVPKAVDPYSGEPMPDALAQLDEVLASLDDPDVVLVDARTPEEVAAGHIPGAVNVNYPLNAMPDPPHTWKPADELLALYGELGVTSDKRVIPYCTSGVRSAVTAFTLRLIGFERVALYTGSWQEWSAHPDTPKATGGS
jgi:thiosulfate/3-mercaptopyruvate sulfurtransferase